MPNPSIEEIKKALADFDKGWIMDYDSIEGIRRNARVLASAARAQLAAEATIARYREAAERAEKLLRTSNSHAAVEASAILREAFEIRPRKKLQGAALNLKLSAPASVDHRRK